MNQELFNGKLVVKFGDLTDEAVDAIVNAANWTLLGGGGVDGAIHRSCGPAILAECKRIRETEYPDGLPTGKAVITTSGDLPAKHVIHTVGPIWYGGDRGEDELLASCYRASLDLAEHHSVRSIAFPAISCGAFGFPAHRAAAIAVWEIRRHLARAESVSTVLLVAFDAAMAGVLRHAVGQSTTR